MSHARTGKSNAGGPATHTSCAMAAQAARAKFPVVNSANPCACPFFQFIWDACRDQDRPMQILGSSVRTGVGLSSIIACTEMCLSQAIRHRNDAL